MKESGFLSSHRSTQERFIRRGLRRGLKTRRLGCNLRHAGWRLRSNLSHAGRRLGCNLRHAGRRLRRTGTMIREKGRRSLSLFFLLATSLAVFDFNGSEKANGLARESGSSFEELVHCSLALLWCVSSFLNGNMDAKKFSHGAVGLVCASFKRFSIGDVVKRHVGLRRVEAG
jgi:hypothetical protein